MFQNGPDPKLPFYILGDLNLDGTVGIEGATADGDVKGVPDRHVVIGRLLSLGDFDRFVFVMSVLERYSDQDCSILLRCARRDIVKARIHSMQRLVKVLGIQHTDRMDADLEKIIKLVVAQHFATAGWTGNLSQ